MSIYVLGPLFPIILGIHNVEEYFRHDDFIQSYPPRIARWLTRPIIRSAMVLLTLATAAVSLLTWIYRTPWLLDISLIADFALMLNAFSHVGRSLLHHSLTPGTLSALCLVLPYSLLVVATLRLSEGMSWSAMFRLMALGIPMIPVAVLVFLALGYALSFARRTTAR